MLALEILGRFKALPLFEATTMGRPFLLKFEHTPANEFYVCCKCETHIALVQDCMFNDANDDDNELKGPVFANAINWHSLEKEPTRTIGDYMVEQIYCNNCGYPLGFQFIETLGDVEILINENDVLLHWPKILLFDGHEIVDPSQVEGGPNLDYDGDEDGHEIVDPLQVEGGPNLDYDGDDDDNRSKGTFDFTKSESFMH